MKSKLLSVALSGILLLGSGLALADGGRGRHDRDSHHGWQDRGWGGGPRWGHPQHYRGHGHGHFQQHWNHGHRFAPRHYHDYGRRGPYYRGHNGHARPYADRGDDITIIFRGSLN